MNGLPLTGQRRLVGTAEWFVPGALGCAYENRGPGTRSLTNCVAAQPPPSSPATSIRQVVMTRALRSSSGDHHIG